MPHLQPAWPVRDPDESPAIVRKRTRPIAIGVHNLGWLRTGASVEVHFDVRWDVAVQDGEVKTTVRHELGHWIEHSGKDVLDKALAELKRRAGGQLGKTKAIYARTREKGYPDAFPLSKYAGKVYKLSSGKIRGTEVVSEGFAFLQSDPYQLATKDRAWFEFMVELVLDIRKR